MTKETVNSIKSKVHWFVIPTLLTFLTWMAVMIYGVDAQVKVLQKDGDNRKEIQEKIYRASEEARTFALENNSILTQKAEKSDVERIDIRLHRVENVVNKIYKLNYSYGNVDTICVPYKPSNNLVENNNIVYANGEEVRGK